MPSVLPFDNPLTYAHLQLRGGWKNVFVTTGAYAGAVTVLVLLSLRLNPGNSAGILAVWSGILIAVQGALLLMFGSSTVSAALRTDLTTGMIESHRLMPVPAGSAVAGYLFGPPCQAIAMFLVTFVIGALTTAGSQKAFSAWAVPNAVLFLFALFIWTVSIFSNLAAKNGFRWVVALITFGVITQGTVLHALPGFLVLVNPVLGAWSLTMRGGVGGAAALDWTHLVGIGTQGIIGLILYAGAARKYARQDAPALSPLLGLLLLATWVGTSAMGIAYWSEFRPRILFGPRADAEIQFIASVILGMLLAATPLGSSARLHAAYQRHRRMDDLVLPPRPIPPLLTAIFAAAIIAALSLVVIPSVETWQTVATQTALIILATLVGLSYVLRIMARRRTPALLIGAVFLFVTWIVPMAVDFVRIGLADDFTTELLTPVSSASPIAALIRIWTGEPGRPIPGVYVQLAVAVGLAILYHAGERKPEPRPVSAAPTPAAD